MPKSKKTSALVKRHIVALFVLPVFIAYIYFLPPLPYFMGFITVVSMIALWEFFVMYKVPPILRAPGIVTGGILFYMLCLYPSYAVNSFFVSLFLLLMLRLLLIKDPSGCMSEAGPLVTGLFYVTGGMSFQWFLRNEIPGAEYIFLLYVSVWLADSMALYMGTYMGKHKLYPSVSPNKTVEGALGSIIGGAMGAVITKAVFAMSGLTYRNAIVIGAVMGITSLAGDLIESMFKRDAGIKDSSNIIPGHGGILDKIDGMLVSGPILYFIVRFF